MAGWKPAPVRLCVCLIRWVKVPSWEDLLPLTDSNCVLVRGGGEQLKVNGWSAGIRTRFGLSSQRACWGKGEAQDAIVPGTPGHQGRRWFAPGETDQSGGGEGWLEAERPEGQAHQAERPVAGQWIGSSRKQPPPKGHARSDGRRDGSQSAHLSCDAG